MPQILVCYGTGEGQTRKVARRIARVLAEEGHSVEVVDVGELPADLALPDFDAVLVGAPVHRRRHQAAIQRCVHRNRDALAGLPSAFFQVSLTSAVSEPEFQERAERLAERFLDSTGWNPDRVALFAGALHYSMYGFVRTLLAKWWARRATGDVDTSYDYEYTDWDAVERFAEEFAAFVDERTGETVDAAGESDDGSGEQACEGFVEEGRYASHPSAVVGSDVETRPMWRERRGPGDRTEYEASTTVK